MMDTIVKYDLKQSKATSTDQFEKLVMQLDYALRYLGDLSKLNRSPLARLNYIEQLAKNEYKGGILPRGQALRRVLSVCINHVINAGSKEPSLLKACQYLKLRAEGHNCQDTSSEMRFSREHVSRHYRKQALELIAEAFLFTIANSK